jgi:hypothetical protein
VKGNAHKLYSGLLNDFGMKEIAARTEGATNSAPNLFSYFALPVEVDVRLPDKAIHHRRQNKADQPCPAAGHG